MTANETRIAAALRYASQGQPVLPLHSPHAAGCSCGRPACASPAKHPRITQGVHNATTNLGQVRRWWQRWPDANIGIATGHGHLVIDLDGPAAATALSSLEAIHGDLPDTWTVTTGRGSHLHYAVDPRLRVANSASALAPGIDIRGDGGYVLAPPSTHPNGTTYSSSTDHTLAQLPAKWVALLAAPSPTPPTPAVQTAQTTRNADHGPHPYAATALESEATKVASAPPGQRNHTLNRAAFAIGRIIESGGLDPNDVHHTLAKAAVTAGLTQREATMTITSGITAGRGNPKPIPTRPPTPTANVRPATPNRPGPVLLRPHGPAGWQWTVTHGPTTTNWRTGPSGNDLYKLDPKRNTWNPVRLRRPFHLPPDRIGAYSTIIRSFTARPPRTQSLGEAAATDEPHRSQRQTIGLGR